MITHYYLHLYEISSLEKHRDVRHKGEEGREEL